MNNKIKTHDMIKIDNEIYFVVRILNVKTDKNNKNSRSQVYKAFNVYRSDDGSYPTNSVYLNLEKENVQEVYSKESLEWMQVISNIFKKAVESDDVNVRAQMYRVLNEIQFLTNKNDLISNSSYIDYNQLETIDDCLDAMNDLKELYNLFNDDKYLKIRENVVGRLGHLCENQKNNYEKEESSKKYVE